MRYFPSSLTNTSDFILGETRGFSISSMLETSPFEVPDNPTNLSRAIGGQVDIRKIGNTSGCVFNTSTDMSDK